MKLEMNRKRKYGLKLLFNNVFFTLKIPYFYDKKVINKDDGFTILNNGDLVNKVYSQRYL